MPLTREMKIATTRKTYAVILNNRALNWLWDFLTAINRYVLDLQRLGKAFLVAIPRFTHSLFSTVLDHY